MSMEKLNQFLDELEKEEGIKVEVEEITKDLADVLAHQYDRWTGGRCARCSNCGGSPESSFEEIDKMAA